MFLHRRDKEITLRGKVGRDALWQLSVLQSSNLQAIRTLSVSGALTNAEMHVTKWNRSRASTKCRHQLRQVWGNLTGAGFHFINPVGAETCPHRCRGGQRGRVGHGAFQFHLIFKTLFANEETTLNRFFLHPQANCYWMCQRWFFLPAELLSFYKTKTSAYRHDIFF